MNYKINVHTKDTKQDFGKPNSKYPKSSRNIDVLFDLKEGIHKIRIIPTMDNELLTVEKEFHEYVVDGKHKKVVCLDPGIFNYDKCPICKVTGEIYNYFLIKSFRLNKSFIYLIDTNSPDEKWIPGNYYILLSLLPYLETDRFEKALTSYVNKTLETGINGKILLGNLFDYTKETQGCLQVRVQSRKDYKTEYCSSTNISSIDISFDPSTKSPKLDEKIIKDLNRYTADYINDSFKEPDLKELEEDAKKLRLEYNNQEQQ